MSLAFEDDKDVTVAMQRNLSGNVERKTSIPNTVEQHGFDVKITHETAKGWADSGGMRKARHKDAGAGSKRYLLLASDAGM